MPVQGPRRPDPTISGGGLGTRTNEIFRSAIEVLLQIARKNMSRPQIPVCILSWLNKWPSLPSGCLWYSWEVLWDAVQMIQDIWSEWEVPYVQDFDEIRDVITENSTGTGMRCHRHRVDPL